MFCFIKGSGSFGTKTIISLNLDFSVKGFKWSLSFFKVYLRALVRNLFNEGNDVYRERDWNNSISQYTEALNIAGYAKSEEIVIPKEIIEKLHINRIACYSNMVSCDFF